ncbi:MAG: ABC transporter substrate-binding protein [Gammaproteobacteria bacterium]|nr:ABC transporter substrate-binding protein [Gammaproteobacteria bacterium]MYD79959.1 ABC transporter substrate-binding protein [Gammaproteobacteria bacterium]
MRKSALAIATTLVMLLIVGCAPQSTSSSTGKSVQGVTDDEILFGSHTDLTGPIAFYGADSVNGARMRFEEANEKGGVHGREIRFVVEDTRYEVPNTIRAVDKLINLDKIFAMYLALGTPNNLAVMDDLFDAGIPNLFPITGSVQMAEPYMKLMFTQRGIYYYEIRAALRYFVENKGRSTPCVAHVDNDFGKEILDGAEDQAAEMELEIAAVTAHKSTETEFTASVLRLRDAGCDLVLMGTVATDTIGILTIAKEIGWEDVDFVGSNAGAPSVIAELESGVGEGYYAFIHSLRIYPDTETNQEAVDWFNRYTEIYGHEPDVTGMEGYRGADLIVIALEKAGRDLTREKFVEALESIGEYKDIFGYTLHFSPENHNGVKESVLGVIENGRWVASDESILIN